MALRLLKGFSAHDCARQFLNGLMAEGKSMFKKTLLLIAASVTVALPSLAHARSVSAFAGLAQNPNDATWWSNWGGAVTNNASTVKRWCIPLAVDTAGYKNVTISAYGPSSGSNVGCFSTSENQHNDHYWPSPSNMTYLPAFGSVQDITLTGAYVPPAGVLFACCDVGPGARLDTVVWDP